MIPLGTQRPIESNLRKRTLIAPSITQQVFSTKLGEYRRGLRTAGPHKDAHTRSQRENESSGTHGKQTSTVYIDHHHLHPPSRCSKAPSNMLWILVPATQPIRQSEQIKSFPWHYRSRRGTRVMEQLSGRGLHILTLTSCRSGESVDTDGPGRTYSLIHHAWIPSGSYDICCMLIVRLINSNDHAECSLRFTLNSPVNWHLLNSSPTSIPIPRDQPVEV